MMMERIERIIDKTETKFTRRNDINNCNKILNKKYLRNRIRFSV